MTKIFIRPLLKGIWQIMLQENSLTGILFLLGIFNVSIFYDGYFEESCNFTKSKLKIILNTTY